MSAGSKIRLGISSCLLGEKVRYDGGHKLDRLLTERLGKHVEYVPVCPEVECGMTVPREPMDLVGTGGSPRLMTRQSRIDMTRRMTRWARPRLNELAGEGLHGFIFKSRSPSCGMERVRVCNEGGDVIGSGPGLFASEFMRRFPRLPVEDEERLREPELRRSFIERCRAAIDTIGQGRDNRGR
ncbi:MAG: DUF523 domain-containing protein [Acidobacteriota bacterium]